MEQYETGAAMRSTISVNPTWSPEPLDQTISSPKWKSQ
jgi:hypothetical protein